MLRPLGKTRLNTGWLYLIVVTVIASAVALFETWGIAHYHVAWGAPLPQDTFWGKLLIRKAPFNIVGFQLLTRYHFFMFCVLVPALVLLIGILLRRMTEGLPAHWFGWLIFAIAGTLGAMVLEDFLFFVFSTLFGTPYPHALTRLFHGEATWQPYQASFFGVFSVPAAYILVPPVAVLLLWLVSRYRL